MGIRIKVLSSGALKTQDKLSDIDTTLKMYHLNDTCAGMAILMGIIQVHLDKVMLSNFDTVLHGFGNIQKVLSSLGYKGEIYG